MGIANLLTTPFFKLLPYKRSKTHFCVHKGLAIQEDKPIEVQQHAKTYKVIAPTHTSQAPRNPVVYSHINWSVVLLFLVFATVKLTRK